MHEGGDTKVSYTCNSLFSPSALFSFIFLFFFSGSLLSPASSIFPPQIFGTQRSAFLLLLFVPLEESLHSLGDLFPVKEKKEVGLQFRKIWSGLI